jgi:hypothetical protein
MSPNGDDEGEDLGEASAPLRTWIDPDLDLDPEPTDEDPTPPAPERDPRIPRRSDLKTLRVDMARVNYLVPLALTGTQISIDATRSARPITVPGDTRRNCTRDDAGFGEAREDCLRLMRGRVACLRAAAAEYPTTCRDVPVRHYSYLSFPASLKAQYPELMDYPFEVDTFRVPTWSGDIDITLNQIQASMDSGNTRVYSGTTDAGAFLALSTTASSGWPTAICRHTSRLGVCPDIVLTNMKFAILFESLGPALDDPSRLAFGQIGTVFSFDRNINNFPDWLVTAFFDIDNRIRSRTAKRVQEAFENPGRHYSMERALTTIVSTIADSRDPSFNGFGAIDEVLSYQGDLYIHYTGL